MKRSPLQYFGGKSYMAKYIVDMFPPHKHYTEVFGGAGSVLLYKDPVYNEIYNDKYNLLVDFFEVIRDDVDKFLSAIQWYPYSRTLHDRMRKRVVPSNKFERALWFFYLNRTSFNGKIIASFSRSKTKSHSSAYRVAIDDLRWYSERLSKVTIECLDFREAIRKYDCPKMLFYVDPPYCGNECCYDVPFEEREHIVLAWMLRKIKGKCVLSYGDSPFIRKLYKDWNLEEKSFVSHSAPVVGARRKTRMELIYKNF